MSNTEGMGRKIPKADQNFEIDEFQKNQKLNKLKSIMKPNPSTVK